MKNKIILLFLLFIGNNLFGQDFIQLNDKTILKTKILEIGNNEIRYKKYDNLRGPEYVIKISEILQIVFENGTVENFNSNSSVDSSSVFPKAYSDFNKNIVGCNYFDLMYVRINLFYERLFPKHNFGLKLNVSMSFNRNNNALTFLDFDRDSIYSVFSFSYYPAGINEISYYTGIDLMAGIGIDRVQVEVPHYTSWGDLYYVYESIDKKINYYGFHFNNGLMFNFNDRFILKIGVGLGLVDRYQNGLFQLNAMGEIAAGIKF